MLDILIDNFVTIFLLIGFLILLRVGNVFDKKTERLLILGAISVISLVLLEMTDYYLSTMKTLNNTRYLTSSLGYILRPVALGIFITILLRKKDNVLHIWIPIIIASFVPLTNYWTHWMFHFTESNLFVRGQLGYLTHVMSFVYMALLLYYAVRRFKVTDFGEILSIFYIVFACLAAIMVEFILEAKFLVSGAIVSSCIIYYTYLYVQVYKTDPLTKVFNRTSFNKDVEKKLNKRIEIIYVDLDNLKYINDNKGHLAGDKALIDVASILLDVSENSYKVYRVGGDEFYILGINKTQTRSKILISNAKRSLTKVGLTASFGYATYRPTDDFADCCIEADKNMYENKANKPVYNQ